MTTSPRPSITAIVLTRDEAGHIERCIESLRPTVARICIVDSGSSDGTREYARARGAEIFEHAWISHSAQFNWALDHCGIKTDWVLRLDADEYLEPALQRELAGRLATLADDVHGVLLPRKYYFLGRWIRHGGMHPMRHLRLWRQGSACIEPRWMDEHAVLNRGQVLHFDGAFVDDNQRDITWWSQKHLRYATLEAAQTVLDELAAQTGPATPAQQLRGSAATRRWLKQRIYSKLPLGVGPLLYFLYRYFLRLGFLDGVPGFAFHFLQGFWYRVLVDLRRREIGRALAGEGSRDGRLDALERVTGLRVREPSTSASAGRP